jgi:restriction system protein
MGRRGFLATVLHQARVASQEHARAQRIAVRAHNAAVRRAEQAQRSAERLHAQLSRASAADRKRLEKEAREAHVEAMEAEVDEKNLLLEEINGDLHSLLATTLEVDDYVDLEGFRVVAEHPPFDDIGLEAAIPPPNTIPAPPEPIFAPPERPKGLIASLFGKKKHAALTESAREAHQQALGEWRLTMKELPARREAAAKAHAKAEAQRLAALEAARAKYAKECTAREAWAADRNRRVDELITNLAYGAPQAVQEYVSIVLSNSVYPAHFTVTHEFEFDPASAELKLRVLVPGPDTIPEVKAYKYTKSTDQIISTSMSQKACRDRFASVVHQVALRSIHEVFESDRRGLIKTISIEVGANTIDPATGRPAYVPFVVAGAERELFLSFDLSAVVPMLTLERLGAAVSKNPYGLVAAEISGIRRT